MQKLDKRGTIEGRRASFVDVRGPSGRLYGRLDPERLILEVKRKGEKAEEIDLKRLMAR